MKLKRGRDLNTLSSLPIHRIRKQIPIEPSHDFFLSAGTKYTEVWRNTYEGTLMTWREIPPFSTPLARREAFSCQE